MQEVTFSTGYLPDPTGHRRTRFRHLATRLGVATVPGKADLRAFAPVVMDQGQTSSCTGHASAGAIATTLAVARTPLWWVPSPVGIYTLGRAIDRRAQSDGTLPPLTDDGAMPNQVFRGISEWGIRPMRGPAPDGRNSDADPATINEEPNLGDLESDSASILVGEYSIDSVGPARVYEFQTALAGGKAIACAIAGGSPVFQQYTGGVISTLNAPLDHYVYVLGYETLSSGRSVFTVRNSWSADWGMSGEALLSEEGLDELGDVVVLDVHMKGA